MLNKRICIICEDPKGFIPKHYRNTVCYKAKCREIYKERQKQRKLITHAEWIKKNYRWSCTRCNRLMKGSGLCQSCISILSDVYADVSLTEGGCFPSEVTLWPDSPEMIYD